MTPDNLMKVWRKGDIAKSTTGHGFRPTFRTWATERTDIPREVLEIALAHNIGTAVEQAHSGSVLLVKRVLTGQLAKRAGILPSRMRFYVKEGITQPVGQVLEGYSLFDGSEAIERLREIDDL